MTVFAFIPRNHNSTGFKNLWVWCVIKYETLWPRRSDGKISKNTKWRQLAEGFPDIFGKFSDFVIPNHLNTAKTIKGLSLTKGDSDE